MKRKLKLGIIETIHSPEQSIIDEIVSLPSIEVVAICHSHKPTGKKIVNRHKIDELFSDPLSLLKKSEIQLVILNVYPAKVKELYKKALEYDKHVLICGSMGKNAAEAQDMIDVKLNYPQIIAERLPGSPSVSYDEMILNLLRRKLGKLIHVELRINEGSFIDRSSSYAWIHDRSLAGNNIHELGKFVELMVSWIGPISEIYANGEIILTDRIVKKDQLAEVSIPDHLMMIGQFEQHNATFSLSYSQVCGFRKECECWLHGEEATIKVDLSKPAIFLGKSVEKELHPLPMKNIINPKKNMKEFVLRHFIEEPSYHAGTFSHGLSQMLILDAVWESMKSGKRVLIPTPLTSNTISTYEFQ